MIEVLMSLVGTLVLAVLGIFSLYRKEKINGRVKTKMLQYAEEENQRLHKISEIQDTIAETTTKVYRQDEEELRSPDPHSRS